LGRIHTNLETLGASTENPFETCSDDTPFSEDTFMKKSEALTGLRFSVVGMSLLIAIVLFPLSTFAAFALEEAMSFAFPDSLVAAAQRERIA
jgi:hypothetical protein